MSDTDVITVQSAVDAPATMQRLINAVRGRGLTVFARIDHGGGAARAGLELRPTDLLIFGDPRGGTALMQADQSLGLDLPLRALVWTDPEAKTWLTYPDLVDLARRHGVERRLQGPLQALSQLLAAVSAEATGPIRPEELLDEALDDSFPASDPPGDSRVD